MLRSDQFYRPFDKVGKTRIIPERPVGRVWFQLPVSEVHILMLPRLKCDRIGENADAVLIFSKYWHEFGSRLFPLPTTLFIVLEDYPFTSVIFIRTISNLTFNEFIFLT